MALNPLNSSNLAGAKGVKYASGDSMYLYFHGLLPHLHSSVISAIPRCNATEVVAVGANSLLCGQHGQVDCFTDRKSADWLTDRRLAERGRHICFHLKVCTSVRGVRYRHATASMVSPEAVGPVWNGTGMCCIPISNTRRYRPIISDDMCRKLSRYTSIDKINCVLQLCGALYMLQHIMSVCPSICLSVCPSRSGIVSKRANEEGCGPHSVSSFLVPRMVDGDDRIQVKFECKELDPLWQQPSYTYFAS